MTILVTFLSSLSPISYYSHPFWFPAPFNPMLLYFDNQKILEPVWWGDICSRPYRTSPSSIKKIFKFTTFCMQIPSKLQNFCASWIRILEVLLSSGLDHTAFWGRGWEWIPLHPLFVLEKCIVVLVIKIIKNDVDLLKTQAYRFTLFRVRNICEKVLHYKCMWCNQDLPKVIAKITQKANTFSYFF